MKSFKKLLTVAGSAVLASMLALTATACNPPETPPGPGPDDPIDKTQTYDPESRKLVMSIGNPDGVFNPFFSTSAYDTTVIGMTQISMLSSDELGNITYGDNEPTVVKDYTSYPTDGGAKTTYEFIIKNDIKFSDGTPLTINDVLFNLYVYLDPVYTGSATIYSTDIVGLSDYRTQTENASDTYLSTFEESFVNEAKTRVNDLIEFMQVFGRYTPGAGESRPSDRWTNDQKTAFKNDYVTVAKAFRDELYSDWNSTVGSMESYIEDWEFTDAWQVFLLNDGRVTELLQTYEEGEKVGQYVKDEDGNYKLNKKEADSLKLELDKYLEVNGYDDSDKEKTVAIGTREWAVDYVFGNYFMEATNGEKEGKYDESAFGSDRIDSTIAATGANGFAEIVRYWATADMVRDKFTAEAKSKYFAGQTRVVPTIKGIDGTTTRTKDFSNKDLGSEHSVLKITINDIDPKAIWNFAFTVAPMHYYSGTYTNKQGKTKNYVEAFDQSKGEFGLEFGDIDFFNKVINSPDKVGLPVGGGAYMAASSNGNAAKNGKEFFNLNNIYYVRNPYFETLGSGINNAKIKYLTYSVVETDQIINKLTTKEIDIGEPNATQDNIRTLNANDDIAHKEIKTSGYGYVGINPRFVPDINVRRAIIKAMDTDSITRDYYQGNLAEIIYRGMSNTSWAYPQGIGVYSSKDGTSYGYDPLGDAIEELVKKAGYTKGGDGVYQKTVSGFGVDRLDYKFTIAGSSTDHPAYNMFLNAAKILNNHGFAVKVVTSQTALSDLSTGKLEVWAAAWSSTIDPDMYQVWHMDSQATSTSNWGYKQIKANKDLYSTEWSIIQDLSELIDAGRATDKKSERAEIYHDALDLVMELAVEMPTYQRKDMTAYNAKLIDESTLQPENKLTAYNGLFSRIWEVNYN